MSSRRNKKQQQTLPLSPILGSALLLVIALVLIISWTSSANASGGKPTDGVAVGNGSLNHPKGWCGNGNGQAACSPASPEWTLITANNTASAIAANSNFASMRNQYGYTVLDTPTLVHAYQAHTGQDYYDNDHLVVTVKNAAGLRCGIFDFVYDSTHTHIRFSSFGVITALDPHSQLAFPYVSSLQAQSVVHTQLHMDLLVGRQPELIFFPIDASYTNRTSPIHAWAGGGNSAMNPMWYVVGSDAQNYFIGSDLHAHVQQELPITTNP